MTIFQTKEPFRTMHCLRAKLKREVSSSAMLGDLLQKVNGMQEVHDCPAEFKGKFDEFVGRVQEYSTAI